MKAQRASMQASARQPEAKKNVQAEHGSGEEVPVKPTPLLIVLGVIALLAGLLVGLLMSQATFLR